jgi:hypothetical protein
MFCFCSDNKLRYRNVCPFVSISLTLLSIGSPSPRFGMLRDKAELQSFDFGEERMISGTCIAARG